MQKIEAERAALQAELGKYTSEVGRLQKEIDAAHLRAEPPATGVVATIEPSLVKDYFRNAPLLDFMAPTLTVRQIVTPNVVDDVNFARVAKMDRCTTCHLAIDRRGYEKYPQPFRTHPNLPAYVGSDSPHPMADDRLHGVPPGPRRFDELQRRVALSEQREAAAGVGGEVPLARAAHVGLPDAADAA